MAEAVLNPLIETMDKSSKEYELFNLLLDAAERANSVDAPDFTTNPPMKKDGSGNQLYDPDDPVVPLVDTEEIEKQVTRYSEIQTKNYAYDLATAIISTAGGGGSGSGEIDARYLPITGGSLTGRFTAKYGVELGDNGKSSIIITHNGEGDAIGYFNLIMSIGGDVSLNGSLSMANQGIWFNKHQTVFIADNALNIDYNDIKITGATNIDGTVTSGLIVVDGTTGITFDGNQFYHAGNSNKSDVDWNAQDLHVYRNLIVDGAATLKGRLQALYGFDLGEKGNKFLYSVSDGTKNEVLITVDLSILGYQHGIKFGEHYVLKTYDSLDNAISLCAPGKILRLGDSELDPSGATDDNGKIVRVPTASITLQSDFRTSDNAVTLVYPDGRGYFLGLQARSNGSGDVVLSTYHTGQQGQGVLFPLQISFNTVDGPSISAPDNDWLVMEVPYERNTSNGLVSGKYKLEIGLVDSDSPFRNLLSTALTTAFVTEGQFFRFEQPVESPYFAIVSNKSKTKLDAGLLFLGDGTFLEAVPGGIFHSGNATFNHSLSSQVFSSGLSGYGWAILENALTGNYEATFDGLTVRKKMKVYEFEVQKQNVTNGSWWVTDSCAGDTVEEI